MMQFYVEGASHRTRVGKMEKKGKKEREIACVGKRDWYSTSVFRLPHSQCCYCCCPISAQIGRLSMLCACLQRWHDRPGACLQTSQNGTMMAGRRICWMAMATM